MQATRDDLATLLKLQHIDLAHLRATKEFSELPQRKMIVEARHKMRTISEKREKVAALKKEAEAKLTRVSDEDASLAEKQRVAQAAVENAQGNYRNVEARTKEMNGFAKRRVTLEAELDKLGAELAKIESIELQVEQAFEEVARKEEEATASFQKQGGALKQEIAHLEAEHAALLGELPEALAQLYEKTAARSGGVAIDRLKDGRCGACRAPIDGGRLIDLKTQSPLGTCPACKRLLIVE